MPKRLTKQQFIANAKVLHGNKYDYSQVKYVNNSTPVTIICKVHGTFQQKPNSHVDAKCGCPICGDTKGRISKRLTTEEFISRARKIHGDKFDYSKTVYITNTSKVKILCHLHGYFEQEAYSHINRSFSGCPHCGNLGISKKAIDWLIQLSKEQNLNIQTAYNGGEYKIPGTKYKADGYCNQTNTIYEFYGDKWHGNLNVFDCNQKCHPFSSKTAKQLNDKTIKREQEIKALGYNLISIWEQEFDKYHK